MLRRTLLLTAGLFIALGTMSLGVIDVRAQAAFVPPNPNMPQPTVRPRVPNPQVTIRVTPVQPQPGGQAQPQPKPQQPQPARPKPQSKPQTRDVPAPEARPLLAFGRPALLDAPRVPNRVVVLIGPADADAMAALIAGEYDLDLVSQSWLTMLNAHMLLMDAGEDARIDDIVTRLNGDFRVIAAQPDYGFALQQDAAASKDTAPMLDLQYAPQRMEVLNAHKLTRGSGATIAVIDTGIDVSHSAFAARRFETFDAVGTPAEAPESHGTAIAGLIAAGADLMGIAPDAGILSVRAFSEDRSGKFTSDSYRIARSVDWAVAHGAQILNMSFAGPADPLVLRLMDELPAHRVLAVAAAGNAGPKAPAAYPAAHPNVIGVTATDARDNLYSNANRGIYVAIAAPGVDVIAPAPGNGYNLESGTSIATAHISGVLALILSERPNLTRAEVLELIDDTATDVGPPGPDPEFGHGLVDAFKATERVAGK